MDESCWRAVEEGGTGTSYSPPPAALAKSASFFAAVVAGDPGFDAEVLACLPG